MKEAQRLDRTRKAFRWEVDGGSSSKSREFRRGPRGAPRWRPCDSLPCVTRAGVPSLEARAGQAKPGCVAPTHSGAPGGSGRPWAWSTPRPGGQGDGVSGNGWRPQALSAAGPPASLLGVGGREARPPASSLNGSKRNVVQVLTYRVHNSHLEKPSICQNSRLAESCREICVPFSQCPQQRQADIKDSDRHPGAAFGDPEGAGVGVWGAWSPTLPLVKCV